MSAVTHEMNGYIRRCAARGARHFDRVMPGWERTVPQTLDVGDGNNCPLYHISNLNYFDALEELGIEEAAGVRLGLDVNQEINCPLFYEVYGVLNLYWRIERAKRLKAARRRRQ